MTIFERQPLPYCGAPPDPAGLLSRWNLDPILLAALAGLLACYLLGAARRGVDRRHVLLFVSGWAVATLALVSPLCPLSVSLFAARIGQHMVLILLAAPLIAAGRPLIAMMPALGARTGRGGVLAASLAFAGLLWFWHAPGPYGATFTNATIYWTMHLSLFGAALWLWHALLAERGVARAIGAAVAASVQMGLLGALITLAPRPLYLPHLLTTAAWGLTPLQDQQLGGALMWVPGCVVFLAVAMLRLGGIMSAPARPRAGVSG